MNKKETDRKGFTMVELVIVVAIMGIIGALLVPAFGNLSAKAKVSTDVSTTKTIKRLIDIYLADGNVAFETNEDAAETIGRTLKEKGYLESDIIALKTEGKLKYKAADGTNSSTLVLDISKTDASIKAAASNMDQQTREIWIEGETE